MRKFRHCEAIVSSFFYSIPLEALGQSYTLYGCVGKVAVRSWLISF
jgi:hypothetical protein